MAKLKRTRYEHVLGLIPDTLSWCREQDVAAIREYLLKKDGLPRVFIGSGGSLSAAHLAASFSVDAGLVAVAMTPYQYIFSSWSKLPAKVIAVSAGGRNVDVINACKMAKNNEAQQFAAILMKTGTALETVMENEERLKAFAFDLPNRDGFLATNSLVAFYCILTRIYFDEAMMVEDWSNICKVEDEIKSFIGSTHYLPTDSWDEHNAALYEARDTDRFYVLYSPDMMPIAIDLESRFSEGAVGCLQISDYRNFAHGRFNWFSRRKGQTAVIALISPECMKTAEGILCELPVEIPVMRMETASSGCQGLLELLLKSMYMAKALGERWGLDIGAPKVDDFGRRIHSKDFV